MKTVLWATCKGGVGKTMLAVHMANWCAEQGHRTLLVDLDFQSHATKRSGVDMDPDAVCVGDVLVAPKQAGIREVIVKLEEKLHLAPAVMRMVRLERQIIGDGARWRYLANALKPVAKDYDLCIVDTHPDLGAFTEAALYLADVTVAPVPYEAGGLDGFSDLSETWDEIRNRPHAQLVAVMNRLDKRNSATVRAIDETATAMELPRLDAVVPKVEAINQAQLANELVWEQPKGEAAGEALADVFMELLTKLEV